MNAPDEQAARIAASLTKAQRRTLADDQGCDYIYARRLRTVHALNLHGLVTTAGDWSLKGYLTPLGLRVRAIIAEQATDLPT